MQRSDPPTTVRTDRDSRGSSTISHAQWWRSASTTTTSSNTHSNNNRYRVPVNGSSLGPLGYHSDHVDTDTYELTTTYTDDRLRFFAFSALEELSDTMGGGHHQLQQHELKTAPPTSSRTTIPSVDRIIGHVPKDDHRRCHCPNRQQSDSEDDDDDAASSSSATSSTSISSSSPSYSCSSVEASYEERPAAEDVPGWKDKLCARWDVITLILAVMCPVVLIVGTVWLVYDACLTGRMSTEVGSNVNTR
ncbi:hypothetical protein FOZ61_009739 [Perkinsus olseni]|uniref:Uncharacterized protein n=1 Tax=Perkinsus olseni TaxID=32597 RepID=A0A7J6KYP6_PEROL|nr:hypothetical protein FOZ61_009739 [Perkinsus olseni]